MRAVQRRLACAAAAGCGPLFLEYPDVSRHRGVFEVEYLMTRSTGVGGRLPFPDLCGGPCGCPTSSLPQRNAPNRSRLAMSIQPLITPDAPPARPAPLHADGVQRRELYARVTRSCDRGCYRNAVLARCPTDHPNCLAAPRPTSLARVLVEDYQVDETDDSDHARGSPSAWHPTASDRLECHVRRGRAGTSSRVPVPLLSLAWARKRKPRPRRDESVDRRIGPATRAVIDFSTFFVARVFRLPVWLVDK